MSVLHSTPYKRHRMFDTAKVRYFWIGRRKMLEFIIFNEIKHALRIQFLSCNTYILI